MYSWMILHEYDEGYKDMFLEKDHILDNNRAFFNGDLKTDEDGYVVVDNEEDFKTALIQEKPIKLTKQLNYRWQYGMFAQKDWALLQYIV